MSILAVAVVLILLFVKHSTALRDLGYKGFNCDVTSGNPKNVHELRPADIKIVAAMGDSLTAGYGAGATSADQVKVNYRGLTFAMGGDRSLEDHITLPNILKKFNRNLFGQSYGTGSPTDWEHAQLNVAVGGATAISMPKQARDLVWKMLMHSDKVDMRKDWKLIHIFIGANDACYYCEQGPNNTSLSTPTAYKRYIEDAIRYLYDNVPRTIVSIISLFNVQILGEIDKTSNFCKALHQTECACDTPQNKVNVSQLCRDYQMAVTAIQNERRFEKADFTVVVQPMMENIFQPKLNNASRVDVGFFAPDCFHFSQYGHAIFAKLLWNNLLQPVGSKVTNYNLTNTDIVLQCPDKACPYIRTIENSMIC